jgi:hypothetical protein
MPKVPERTQHFSQKLELASAQTCRNTNDFLRGKLIFDFLGPNPNGERGLQNGLDFTPVDYSCQDSFDHFAQFPLALNSKSCRAFCQKSRRTNFCYGFFTIERPRII